MMRKIAQAQLILFARRVPFSRLGRIVRRTRVAALELGRISFDADRSQATFSDALIRPRNWSKWTTVVQRLPPQFSTCITRAAERRSASVPNGELWVSWL